MTHSDFPEQVSLKSRQIMDITDILLSDFFETNTPDSDSIRLNHKRIQLFLDIIFDYAEFLHTFAEHTIEKGE